MIIKKKIMNMWMKTEMWLIFKIFKKKRNPVVNPKRREKDIKEIKVKMKMMKKVSEIVGIWKNKRKRITPKENRMIVLMNI